MVKNPLSERGFLFKAFLGSRGETGVQPRTTGPAAHNQRPPKLPITLGLNYRSAGTSAYGKPRFRTREEHLVRVLREHL